MQQNDKKRNFSKSKLFLSLMFSAGMLAGSANKLLAQSIIPASDTTGTIVTPTGPQFDIRGGQLSGDGANLFHSFQQFNLSNGEIANFISNPDIRNILGRINGNQASYINGLIQVSGGNSNLFLMNPAGILFGPNASLNVPADFTATTSTSMGFNGNSFNAVGDNNWAALVGNPTDFSFALTQPGSIVNLGNLTLKPGNNLTLLAGTILNTGTLSSSGGNITLAAVEGESRIRISQPGHLLNVEFKAENLAGGVNFNPLSLPELLTGVGISEASGLRVNGDGTVTLTNSNFSTDSRVGTTIISGNINVSSPLEAASFTGGEVNILGSRVGLMGANIDASGMFGGGVVRVGGDYKGQGILPNASYTFASSDSLINVSALQNGNGGRAIIWADDSTRFLGTILARGGQFSGNGGFVETSGKQFLEVTQTPDITARAGMGGSWLLDPNNINIVAGGGNSNISNSGGVFSTTNDSAQIGVDVILAALNGGGNVTLETGNAGTNLQEGDINLNTPLDFNGRGNGTLTLNAANNININSNIIDSVVGGDSLNLNFNAGGGLNITNAIINTGGGNITAVAGINAISPVGITINNSTINASGGNISLNSTGGNIPLGSDNYGIRIYTNSIIQTNGIGTISLNGTGGDIPSGDRNYGIFIQNNSTIQTTDSATISLNATGGSGTNENYGFLIQDAGSKISSQNGDINITGNGGNGSGQFNVGIAILGGAGIESTGTAKINLNGTGGSGIDNNRGINIQGNGSKVSSQNGDINITGNGGNGTGQLNLGIEVLVGAVVESTGTGKINLNGTGGSGTNNNFGISIQVGGSKVSSQNGDINIIGNGGNGTGNLNRGINIANTGVVESTGTATITLNGTGGSGIDNNDGVSIQNAGSKISSQNGDINIIGTAGNGTGGYNTGIAIINGGVVESTGTAKINLNGTGGSGTLGNVGINILDAGSKISSQNGDLNLIGAGGNSSGEFNVGINILNGGIVESTGTAKINLNGTGGSGTNENRGININGAGSKISSQNGDINITGAANATGNGNAGVSFQNSSILESTAGDITVTGNSAAGTSIFIADSFINPNGSTGTLTLQADQFNFTGTNQINSNLTLSAVPNSTNTLTLTGNISFSNPLTITGTSINTTGSTLTGTNNAPLSVISSGNIVTGNIINPGGNITFNTPGNITLNNNLDTSTTAGGSGGNIIFTGDVTLAQSLTLNTVGTLGSGNITFSNRVNSTTTAETLTLNTGIGNIAFNGAVGDITPLAALTINNTGTTQFNNAVTVQSLTTDSGGATVISGNITTRGSSGQNYGETVTLVGDITLTADEINFANTVSGNGNLTLQPYTASSPISLGGANDSAVGTLDLTAAEIRFLQNNFNSITIGRTDSTGLISLAGDTTFSDPLTLRSPAGNGAINTQNFTLTGSDNASFTLQANSDISTGNIITTGGGITINSTTGNVNTSAGTLDAASTVVNGGEINLSAGSNISPADIKTSNNNITFNSPVNLVNDAEFSSNGGAINFLSTLDGNQNLTINTGTGNITFNGAVGNTTPLTSLTANSAGTTQFNNSVNTGNLTTDNGGNTTITGNITTTGSVNFNDAVSLANAVTIATNNNNLTFGNTLNGNQNLTINTGTGNITFNGAVGNTNPLTSLIANSAGNTLFNSTINTGNLTTDNGGNTTITGNITTTGSVNFNDAVSLANAVTIATNNNNLTFGNTLDGNQNLTINAGTGNITFNGAVGNLTPLTSLTANSAGTTQFNSTINTGNLTTDNGGNTQLNGNITTTGSVNFNDAVSLANAVTIATNNNNLTFGNTLDGNQNLTINTGTGNITFNGAVGNTNPLTSLIANSAGTTQFNSTINTGNFTTDNGGNTTITGNITTTGIVNFNDAVSLANAVTIATNNNNLTFGNTLNGNQNLTVNTGTGNITFNGAVGNLTPLNGITVNATNIEAKSTLTTATGGVNINAGGTVNLNQNLQSAGVVNLTNTGNITTADITSNAAINLTTTNGNISAGNINTSSNTGDGADINLTSITGSITTANLLSNGSTNGGNITVKASTQITAGEINSSGNSGRGGNVLLDPSGDIQVTSINAQGATEGGNIDITTGRYFRATGTFQNPNGENVSLSSFGNNNSGSITIRHGGNGITPFVIGNSTTNGTAGNIISASDNLSTGSFLYTFTIGKIGIISVPEPPQTPTTPIQTPPQETPTNQPPNSPQVPVNDVPVQTLPTPQLPVNDVPVQLQTPQQLPVNDVPVQPQTPQQLPVNDVPVQTEPLQNEQQTSVDETTFFRRLLKALDNPGFLVRDQILTYENSQISQLSDSAKWLYIKEIAKFAQIQEKDYENLLANSDPTKLLMKFKELASSQLLIVSKKYENNYNNNSGESSISSNSNSTNPPQSNNISTTTIITNPLTQVGDNYQIIWEIEQKRNIEYQEHFGIETKTLSQEILLPTLQETLKTVATQTGKRAAIIYTLAYQDQLLLILVPPDNSPIYYNIPQAPKEKLLSVVNNFIQETTNITRLTRNSYLAPSQQLYQWIIAPLEKDLKQLQIDTLLFSLDPGLRSLPLAAMHDGKEFLIEKYSLSLIPSFTLIDSNYASIRGAKVLAMGASQLTNQNPLPGVPVELQSIRLNNWKTQSFLNQEFTLKNLINQRQNQPYEIIHLATHADFQPGDPSNSYIQLWDRKLLLSELPTMNWKTPPVELLVLSACRTAFGDKQAELGFGGLAIQAGVKSALASLWYVSDKGTLALMNGFYGNLLSSGIKAEALRQAQLDMIHGKINIQGNKMITRAGVLLLPEELSTNRIALFSHPYYWSGFTLIGSPW